MPKCSTDSAISGVRHPVLAFTPSLPPENLGDPEFKKRHNLRYAYVGGAMANGITSIAMVEALGKAGMMGFYGAAGLTLAEVEKAIYEVQRKLGNSPYGFNLIHSPGDPDLEDGAGQPLHQTRHSKGLRIRISESDTCPGALPGFGNLSGQLREISSAPIRWLPKSPGKKSHRGFFLRRRKKF